MTQTQAARTSLREYMFRRRGKERELHIKWEIARWSEWMRRITLPGRNKPASPEAMWRFPWEDAPEGPKPEDCHISEETLAWLNDVRRRHYNS